MAQATHTPGPWWRDDDGFVAAGSGDSYVTVADPNCSDMDIDEREANLNLIAAAPDMLAAIDIFRREWNNFLANTNIGQSSYTADNIAFINELEVAMIRAYKKATIGAQDHPEANPSPTPAVVVTIEDGNVQQVHSTIPLRLVVFDYDAESTDPVHVAEQEVNVVTGPISEFINEVDTDMTGDEERELISDLKALGL